jgi:hypothetical protein
MSGSNSPSFIPYGAIGEIRLGASRADVASLNLGTLRQFKEDPEDTRYAEAYDDIGVHIYYDNTERVEFIETFKPMRPTLEGLELMGRDIVTVVGLLDKRGHGVRENVGSYMFDTLGLALYAPSGTVEGVALYRRGYYDD